MTAASRARGAAAITAAAALVTALSLAPAWLQAALEYQRGAILSGQLWRLWSGHAVHWSSAHAVTDMVALAAAAAVYQRRAGRRAVAGALLFGAPFISLGLLLAAPDMTLYRGASGLCVMYAVLAGASLWTSASTAGRIVLLLLASALAAKTGSDLLGIAPAVASLPSGIAVAWQAHALGAACGVIIILRRAGIRRPGPTSLGA